MTIVGNVLKVSKKICKEIEWRIENFFSLPVDGRSFRSYLFSVAGKMFRFDIYPNGCANDDSVGYISLYLCRHQTGPPIHVAFSLSFKTLDGMRDGEKQFTHVYEQSEGWGHPKFMARSTLLERRVQLVPYDTLTVICTINLDFKPFENTGKTIKCPLRSRSDHECEMARVKATEKLIKDLGEMFKCDEHSDVIIKLKNEEFRLHRNILTSRSLYFRTMFNVDMKEKTTGIVTIDDCDADIFRNYALFLYTGKVDEMTEENVCDLYEVADMYQEEQLKDYCLCFMKVKMSVENFCNFFVLALKHNDKELLQCATDLFCRHTIEIIQSVKWKTFLIEYPIEANELHIKALHSKCK